MPSGIRTSGLLAAVVLAAALAGCGGSPTGVLTGQIRFVGRAPPGSMAAQDDVVVLHRGVPIDRRALHPGRRFTFRLPPGDYTVELRGPDTTRWTRVGTVHPGATTYMDLAVVVYGSGPTPGPTGASGTVTASGTVPTPTSVDGRAPPQASPAQTEVEHNALGPVCVVSARPGSSRNAPRVPASLPAHPVGVDAVRIPGLNDPACSSGVVSASGAMATRLAADVNATSSVPSGAAYNCPADDDHGIDLVFRYAHPSEAIALSVALGGCLFLTGLGTERWTGPTVTADLARFVPPTWF